MADEDTFNPQKKDTLLSKVKARNRRRQLWAKVKEMPPQGWVNIGEMLLLGSLFAINFWLLSPFFGKEDTTNTFSAPLIPILAKLTEFLMPYSYGIRFWILAFFLAFPFAFYFFIREISGRKLVAALAVLIANLPLSFFLDLRADFGLVDTDGAQVASLSLGVLGSLFLLQFLRRGDFKLGMAASLTVMLVALTSPMGLVVFLCFALIIAFSEMLLGNGRLKFFRLLTVMFLAFGFSAFWYNPKFTFLMIKSSQGQTFFKAVDNLIPTSFFLVPLLTTFGFLIFENRPHLQSLFLGMFLTIGFGLISLGGGFSFPAPSRFLPALGVSLAFFGGVVLANIFDFFQKPFWSKKLKFFKHYQKLSPYFKVSLPLILFISAVVLGINFRQVSKPQVLGLSDVKGAGIWEMRGKTDGLAQASGTIISFMTLGSAVFLGVSLKKGSIH